MANAMDFIDPANRLAVLEQVTAERHAFVKKRYSQRQRISCFC